MFNYSPDYETFGIEKMQDPQAYLRIALQDPCGDPRRALEAMIAAIDRTLSNQIRPILHHPDLAQWERSCNLTTYSFPMQVVEFLDTILVVVQTPYWGKAARGWPARRPAMAHSR